MRMKKLREMCDCDMDIGETPIKPQKVICELSKVAEGRCLRVHRGGPEPDVGGPLPRMKQPNHFITSGGMGTMGFGFPASSA